MILIYFHEGSIRRVSFVTEVIHAYSFHDWTTSCIEQLFQIKIDPTQYSFSWICIFEADVVVIDHYKNIACSPEFLDFVMKNFFVKLSNIGRRIRKFNKIKSWRKFWIYLVRITGFKRSRHSFRQCKMNLQINVHFQYLQVGQKYVNKRRQVLTCEIAMYNESRGATSPIWMNKNSTWSSTFLLLYR